MQRSKVQFLLVCWAHTWTEFLARKIRIGQPWKPCLIPSSGSSSFIQAGPVQGSSQNVAHPPTSNVLSAPGIQDNNNIVHHLYGPLQRPSSGNSTGNGHMGPKAWRPENHQRNNQLYGSSVQHQNSGNQQGRGPFTNNQTWQKPYTNSSSNFRPPVNQQVFNSNIQVKARRNKICLFQSRLKCCSRVCQIGCDLWICL